MMRTLFVLASGLKVLFPISPTAPIERRNSGGRKRFTESATSSNGSSISSSSSVALLHVTTSLGLPSSLSSSSPQCEFGSDQLSPRPRSAGLLPSTRVVRLLSLAHGREPPYRAGISDIAQENHRASFGLPPRGRSAGRMRTRTTDKSTARRQAQPSCPA